MVALDVSCAPMVEGSTGGGNATGAPVGPYIEIPFGVWRLAFSVGH
jgi:hypothetical protein